MKENNRFSQTSRLVTASHPNEIGLKWNFFRFSAILKNVSLRNSGISAFSIFYQLITTIGATLYPIFLTDSNKESDSGLTDLTFFPNCETLQKFIPGIIPIQGADILSFIFILIPIICFFICLINHDYLLYLYPFLSQQILSIVYPYICISFSYTLMYFIYARTNIFYSLLNFVLLLLFLIFIVVYTILIYVDNNSIIAINNVTGEWFQGFTPFMPIYTFFIFFVSIQSQNMEVYGYLACFIVSVLISLAAAIYVIAEMPMLNLTLNCMIASHYIIIFILLVLDSLVVTFEIIPPKFLIMFSPLVSILIYVFIKFLCDRRRISIQQFIDQFDNTSTDYTVSAISTTLESLKTERQVRLLIYEGLQSGNRTVLSPAFVQFCLEKFPKSKWIVSYVAFLYAISWGTYPRVYKFLLHTLSLDHFGMRNMHVFQAIYCLMQTAERLSPVIARELDDYRCEVAQFASIHRTFWRSVLYSDSESFHDAFFLFHSKIKELERTLKILEMKYPYCSSIASENALFFADMKHNFLRSSQYYTRAVQLLNNTRTYIVNDLFASYSMLFPICQPAFQEDQDSNDSNVDELRFISITESHEHALRYMTLVSSHDEYLQALTHAFSVPTAHQPVDISFDQIRTIFLKLTFILTIIFFVIVCLIILGMTNENEDDREIYNSSVSIINSMMMFRNEVHLARQDVRLVANILTDQYNDTVKNSIYYNISSTEWINLIDRLFNLSRTHVRKIESLLHSHIFLFNTKKINNSIIFEYPVFNNSKYDFVYLYSGVHYIMDFMLSNREKDPQININMINSLDNYSIKLIELCEDMFSDLVKSHDEWVRLTVKKNISKFVKTLGIIFTAAVFIIGIHVFSMMTMQENMFAVIKTIQPSMLKSISSIYDKLITHEMHQKQVPHDVTFIRSILSVTLAFIFLMVAPVFMISLQVEYNNSITPANKTLMDMVDPNNVTQFITFSVAILESYFRLNESATFQSKESEFIYNLALNSTTGCMYYMFNSSCNGCYTTTDYYNKFSKITMWTATYSSIVLALLFLVIFIVNGYKVINIGRSVEDIMKFVPQAARKSNPVLNGIMVGVRTPIREVTEFVDCIRTEPSDLEFFAIICLGQVENVIEIKGDITRFFPFVPNFLSEIRDYIINHTNENRESVKQFFDQKKPLETRSVAIDEEREIALTFSRKGAILLVKDDTHHHAENSRLRMVEQLQSTVKEIKDKKKNFQIQNSIVAIVDVPNKELHKDICCKLEKIVNVADTRFRKVISICEPEKSKILTDLLKNIYESHKNEIKIVIHCGGNVSVLACAPAIEKSRLFGVTYDQAKLLLRRANYGDVILSQQFKQLMNQ